MESHYAGGAVVARSAWICVVMLRAAGSGATRSPTTRSASSSPCSAPALLSSENPNSAHLYIADMSSVVPHHHHNKLRWKDSQLQVAWVAETGERLQARLRNTDPSITARNTTFLVTFWNAANQAIESTCVRLGEVRPGEEVEFEVVKPAGAARISTGAKSTWDR